MFPFVGHFVSCVNWSTPQRNTKLRKRKKKRTAGFSLVCLMDSWIILDKRFWIILSSYLLQRNNSRWLLCDFCDHFHVKFLRVLVIIRTKLSLSATEHNIVLILSQIAYFNSMQVHVFFLIIIRIYFNYWGINLLISANRKSMLLII